MRYLGILKYRPLYRLYVSLSMFYILLVIGTIGYMVLERFTLLEALYMTIITQASVGFMEVRPLSNTGRIFTIFLIVANITAFAFFLSMITRYFVDGEFKKALQLYTMKEEIAQLRNHVIVCGLGRNGREAVKTLHRNGTAVVAIEKHDNKFEMSKEAAGFHIHADATRDEVLIEAGISNAQALITTLPDDADNVFVVLTARQLNPGIQIISRASNDTSVSKLKTAGANNVIMPDKLGGTHMAMLTYSPDVKEFIDQLSMSSSEALRVIELPATKKQRVGLLDVWAKCGATLLGTRQSNGSFRFNLSADDEIAIGEGLILMGSEKQLTSAQLLV